MVEANQVNPSGEIVEGLNQKYIDSQDKRARRLMSSALQHFGAAPIKWGVGGFMLYSTAIAERPDLLVAIIGGGNSCLGIFRYR